MRFFKCCAAALFFAVCVIPASAQSFQETVTLTADAPVFLSPDANLKPVRIGKQGSVLRLLELTADWIHVEYDDPQFGRRQGTCNDNSAAFQLRSSPPLHYRLSKRALLSLTNNARRYLRGRPQAPLYHSGATLRSATPSSTTARIHSHSRSASSQATRGALVRMSISR